MSDPPTQPDSAPVIRDTIVREARNFTQLIALAQANDPHLSAVLTEKSLIASKTVWGPAIIGLVSWAATRYGLDIDPQTCAAIAGVLMWLGTAVLRYFSTGSIGSILPP